MKSHREEVTHEHDSITNSNNNISKLKFPTYNTSRRTPSISSSSSTSTSTYEDSISPSSAPSTPFHYSISTVGSIPFSWESYPGMPKADSTPPSSRNRNHNKQLPLPPLFSTNATKLIPPSSPNRRDPFFAALLECSKGGGGGGGDNDGGACDNDKRKGRRVRVRYFSNMSCKNGSAVVESLARAPRRIGYDVLKKSPH